MSTPNQYDLPLAHKIPRRWWEKYAHRLELELMRSYERIQRPEGELRAERVAARRRA